MTPATASTTAVWRLHVVPALITVAVWAGTTVAVGVHPAVVLLFLILLEITFSFDNAVVNAKLVGRLSPFWERLFMTFGLLFAVGFIRFALPVVIVALGAGVGVPAVIDMLWHDIGTYQHHLAAATPMIEAFGGTFLLMIALGFFLDDAKKHHWLKRLERRLTRLGRYGNVGILGMLAGALVMFFTVDHEAGIRAAVFAAAVCGIALHVALDLFTAGSGEQDDGKQDENTDSAPATATAKETAKLVGRQAAAMFARLEVLDASFSFDGVIGAFAITTDVILIAIGLGIGALWVRSLTVHLVRQGTLARFRYLEHGAHWAIFVLGLIMIVKLYGWHPSELLTGSVGIVVISAAVASSIVERRRSAACA